MTPNPKNNQQQQCQFVLVVASADGKREEVQVPSEFVQLSQMLVDYAKAQKDASGEPVKFDMPPEREAKAAHLEHIFDFLRTLKREDQAGYDKYCAATASGNDGEKARMVNGVKKAKEGGGEGVKKEEEEDEHESILPDWAQREFAKLTDRDELIRTINIASFLGIAAFVEKSVRYVADKIISPSTPEEKNPEVISQYFNKEAADAEMVEAVRQMMEEAKKAEQEQEKLDKKGRDDEEARKQAREAEEEKRRRELEQDQEAEEGH